MTVKALKIIVLTPAMRTVRRYVRPPPLPPIMVGATSVCVPAPEPSGMTLTAKTTMCEGARLTEPVVGVTSRSETVATAVMEATVSLTVPLSEPISVLFIVEMVMC